MDGPLISIRSLKAIRTGAEVFISYIDNTNPYTVRQQELAERYRFTCTCTKCILGPTQREDAWLRPADQLSSSTDDLAIQSQAQQAFAKDARYHVGDTSAETRLSGLQGFAFFQVDKAREEKDPRIAVRLLESAMRLCKTTTLFASSRQPYAAARSELFANMLLADAAGDAVFHGVKVFFDVDPALYPQDFHPVRVVHTWALVKVVMWLYERPEHNVTRKMLASGFDFAVPIWKLLKGLVRDVGRSHGNGRFRILVEGTAEDVRREIGERGISLLEADRDGHWGRFRSWKDGLLY